MRLNQVEEEVEAEVRVAVEVTEVEEVTGEEEVIAVDVVMQGGGEVEVMKIEVVEEAGDTKEEGGAQLVGAVEELEVVVEVVAVAPVVVGDDRPTSQSVRSCFTDIFISLVNTLFSHKSIFLFRNIQKMNFFELIIKKDSFSSNIIFLFQDEKVIDNIFLIYKTLFYDCKTMKYRKLDGTFQCRITYKRNMAATFSFK